VVAEISQDLLAERSKMGIWGASILDGLVFTHSVAPRPKEWLGILAKHLCQWKKLNLAVFAM
jgi:hypothetical protein